MEQNEGTLAGAVQDAVTDANEEARIAAEQAVAKAAAGHVPAGMTVASDGGDRAVGRRIHDDARAASQPGDVIREDDGQDEAEARARVAAGKGDEADVDTTTEWLLSDKVQVNTRRLKIRLGGSDENPIYGAWIIGAIDTNVIRQAEREAAGDNRAQRRSGQGYDELKANLRVVAAGTLQPPVKELAKQKGLADPVLLLRERFQYRVGVIAAIAAEIMALSGFDQDDVRAAGES